MRNIEMCDPFGWHRVRPTVQQEIMKKLGEFESMTWSQILIQAKKRNHHVEVYKLCKPARDRLAETCFREEEELLSLRLSGEQRVWGRLDGNVLELIWWDPEHSICPSLLKHT